MSIATRYSQSPTEETNSPTISLASREFAKTRRYAVSIGSPGHDDATGVVSASLDHPGRVIVSAPRTTRPEPRGRKRSRSAPLEGLALGVVLVLGRASLEGLAF